MILIFLISTQFSSPSYLYTGSLDFKSSLDKILNFADNYQLKELKSWSENELIQKITIENINQVPHYYLISHQCNAETLKEQVRKFLKANFNQVSETDEWKKLTETQPHLAVNFLVDFSRGSNESSSRKLPT